MHSGQKIQIEQVNQPNDQNQPTTRLHLIHWSIQYPHQPNPPLSLSRKPSLQRKQPTQNNQSQLP